MSASLESGESAVHEESPMENPMKEVEKNEEAKLRAKYPQVMRPGVFLQKRLQKGQKYFDSGDYNMAKARGAGNIRPPVPVVSAQLPTGDAIPTPEDLPTRKTSIVQSKLANDLS